MADEFLRTGLTLLLAAAAYGAVRVLQIEPPTGPALPDARRAGRWSLVVLLLTCLLLGGLMTLVSASRAGSPAEGQTGNREVYSANSVFNALLLYLIFAAPALLVMRLRHEPPRSAGVRRENLVRSLLLGLGLGMVPVAGVLLTPGLPRAPLSASHFWALLYFGVVGFGEEFVFRGYLQTRLVDWLGHVPGWLLASVELIPLSLLLGALMVWSGNVVLPGILHTFMDWANTLIG